MAACTRWVSSGMAGHGARRLTLLRHAKSDQDGSPDHGRVLAARGRRQAPAVAEHLRETGRLPDLVLCSTATRARLTWELVLKALGEVRVDVRYLDELYLAGGEDVLAAIAEVSDAVVDLLVVGHEPTTSEVAQHLAGPGSDPAAVAQVRVGVPTASLCLLETDARWSDLGDEVTPAVRLTAVLTPGA